MHVLVVPKRHLADIGELGSDPAAAAAVVAGIGAVARHLGLSSYRTVFNTGAEAGQSVFHAHAHVLGGRDAGLAAGLSRARRGLCPRRGALEPAPASAGIDPGITTVWL